MRGTTTKVKAFLKFMLVRVARGMRQLAFIK
jgi:hypothetical protein